MGSQAVTITPDAPAQSPVTITPDAPAPVAPPQRTVGQNWRAAAQGIVDMARGAAKDVMQVSTPGIVASLGQKIPALRGAASDVVSRNAAPIDKLAGKIVMSAAGAAAGTPEAEAETAPSRIPVGRQLPAARSIQQPGSPTEFTPAKQLGPGTIEGQYAPKTIAEKADHFKGLAGNAKAFEQTFGQPLENFVDDKGQFDMKEFMQSVVKPENRGAAGASMMSVSKQFGADGVKLLSDVSHTDPHEWDSLWYEKASKAPTATRPKAPATKTVQNPFETPEWKAKNAADQAAQRQAAAENGGKLTFDSRSIQRAQQLKDQKINGSGESDASLEAQSAAKSDKVNGVGWYRVDTRSGIGQRMSGLRPEDQPVAPHEEIVKLHPDKTIETVKSGSKTRRYNFKPAN